MEIRLYFQMLRRGWWIVALTTLVAVATALGISYFATPEYTAMARFIVSPSGTLTTGSEVTNALDTLNNQSTMATYTEIILSGRIHNDTLALMGLPADGLKNYTTAASVLSNSNIIELSVTGPDPLMAAKIANTMGDETVSFTSRLNQVFSVEILDRAIPPVIPTSPKPLLSAGLAIVLGLFIGVIFAILNEQLGLSFEAFRQRLHFDEITGVYNSRYFTQLVEEELKQSSEGLLSIGIIELSGLRDLVETLPFVSLQRVFQQVITTLRNELRGNDVVGRWNDISFIVMLPNTRGRAAQGIFERIYQALLPSIMLDQLDANLDLDPHIGGAELSSDISLQEFFEKANSALQRAQRDRENPIYVWEIKNPFWVDETVDE
jgi:diguanylate cyclase (GGDEF)-like protein